MLLRPLEPKIEVDSSSGDGCYTRFGRFGIVLVGLVFMWTLIIYVRLCMYVLRSKYLVLDTFG